MSWRTWMVMVLVVATTPVAWSTAGAQGAVTATLSVLAGPVDRIAGSTGVVESGVDGMNLAEGDRVRAGSGGIALITFLDGSTVTVLSDADVTVRQIGRPGTSGIRILIHAGRVWARVVQAVGSRSVLTLESNEYAATAHDGLIGAAKTADGFVCWTRRGTLDMTSGSGHAEAVLLAGQWAWGRLALPVHAEPFVPSASVLQIQATGPIAPLVRMPDGRTAAGFLTEDVEVNQVFGSLTEASRGRRWLVEVPAGAPGPYTLVLTGVGAGRYAVRITARYLGFSTSRQEITGEARPGERVFTRITPRVKGDDPQTARVSEAGVEELRAWDGAEPAIVVAAGARRPRAD